jgi:FAD:protein FMN transferase
MQPISLSRSDGLWKAQFTAMGGPCEILVDSAVESVALALADQAAQCAWRIDAKYSRYRSDNIVARINSAAGAPVEVDDETAKLLDFADRAHELSAGAFDITSGVLRRAWTFDGGERSPTQAQIDRLLKLVGWQKAVWDRPRLTLLPDMQVDFGGIGKEYAVDQATQMLARLGDVPTLVNFGGDLAVTRPRRDGRPWCVGVADVADPDRSHPGAAKFIELTTGAVATSGDTFRYVTSNGQRLPHILDPRSGAPIRGAPRSVTVAAATCTNAGMLTTLAMLRGLGAEEFLAAEGVRHWIQR